MQAFFRATGEHPRDVEEADDHFLSDPREAKDGFDTCLKDTLFRKGFRFAESLRI